ncbi:hypothetical protein ACFQ6Q_30225, partial [Streptomyces sp. NPDC056437]
AENGVKYRVPGKDALAALGYGEGDIGSVPAPLLAALPTGADRELPDLSRASPAAPEFWERFWRRLHRAARLSRAHAGRG